MSTSREVDDSPVGRLSGVSCWSAQCLLFSLVFEGELIVDMVRFLEEPFSSSMPRSSWGGDSVSLSGIRVGKGTAGRGKQGADASSRIWDTRGEQEVIVVSSSRVIGDCGA